MSGVALAVRPFDFEGRGVRVVEQDGEPWFVGRDICEALEIQVPQRAFMRVPEDEKGVLIVNTPGGPQQVVTVNEPGMYRLVLTSRTSAAERFKTWVVRDVLPAIRKHGVYGQPANDVGALQATVARLAQQVHDLQGVVAGLMPKAEALDRLVGRGGVITRAARTLNHLASVGAAQARGEPETVARLALPGPDGRRLHVSEQAVLNAMRHAATGNQATLTNADLAEITSMSRRQVNYALRTLSELGYISRHFEPGGPPTTYLHLPAGG